VKKEKYSKMINIPIREEMLLDILKICEEQDIPLTVFVRNAIKQKLKEEISK